MLAEIDCRRLLATPLFDRILGRLNLPTSAAFDPRRDLDSIQISWARAGMLLAARGRFAGLRRDSSLAARLIFIDDQTALYADRGLAEAAARSPRKSAAEVAEAFAAPLAALDPSAQAWLVSRDGLPFANLPLRPDYASLLANFAGHVNNTAAAFTFSDGLQFRFLAECRSAASAKRLTDGMHAALGLARMPHDNRHPDLLSPDDLRLLDALQLATENNRVTVAASFPSADTALLLDRLFKAATSRPH